MAAAILVATTMLASGTNEQPRAWIEEPNVTDPWPMARRDADRTAAGPAWSMPSDAHSIVRSEGATGLAGIDSVYLAVVLGDLTGDERADIITSLGGPFGGEGGLAVYANGSHLRWRVDFDVDAGPPLLVRRGPVDGSAVFVASGWSQFLFDPMGQQLWESRSPAPTHYRTSLPLAVDLTGDGHDDIVQTTDALEETLLGPGGSTILRTAPILFVMEGASGDVIFAEEFPCGDYMPAPLAYMRADGPHLVAACTWSSGAGQGSIVRDYRVRPSASNLLEQVLVDLGVISPIEVQVAWEVDIQDGSAHVWRLLRADVRPDSGLEIVVASHTAAGTVLTVLSEDGVALAEVTDPEAAGKVAWMAAARLDGDDLDDVVLGHPGGPVVAYSLAGDDLKTLWRATGQPAGSSGAASPGTGTLSDIDGDGQAEFLLIWQDSSNQETGFLQVYAHDGTVLRTIGFTPDVSDPAFPEKLLPVEGPAIGNVLGGPRPELVIPAAAEVLVLTADP